jgi:hypothetical protein
MDGFYWPTDVKKILDLIDFAITNETSDTNHYGM